MSRFEVCKLTAIDQMILEHVSPLADDVNGSLPERSDVDLEESAENLVRLNRLDLNMQRLVAIDHLPESLDGRRTRLGRLRIFVGDNLDLVGIWKFRG